MPKIRINDLRNKVTCSLLAVPGTHEPRGRYSPSDVRLLHALSIWAACSSWKTLPRRVFDALKNDVVSLLEYSLGTMRELPAIDIENLVDDLMRLFQLSRFEADLIASELSVFIDDTRKDIAAVAPSH
jgi:hypothetical protein